MPIKEDAETKAKAVRLVTRVITRRRGGGYRDFGGGWGARRRLRPKRSHGNAR
jgi:hypothetical protein